VVIIRGLTSKWKQTVGYYLACGGTKSGMLQKIVSDTIDLVAKAGGVTREPITGHCTP